jgi:hypothetical protein
VVDAQQPASASREEMERLALIRYQLDLALRQADQPHPLNGFCLLGFQDAVESFLHLAADHIGIRIKSDKFPDYVDGVSSNMPDNEPLVYRKSLLSLNNARVALKHHGNLPAQGTIKRHRATSLEFFDDTTPRLFGVSFDSISLTQLIGNEEVRQHVQHAEQAWQEGRVRTTMTELRFGFDALIRDHDERRPPFTRRPVFPLPESSAAREVGVRSIIKWLEALEQELALISLGVDLHQYAFFRSHTPGVHYVGGGRPTVDFVGNVEDRFNEEVFEFCRQFVIDTALQLPHANHPEYQQPRLSGYS